MSAVARIALFGDKIDEAFQRHLFLGTVGVDDVVTGATRRGMTLPELSAKGLL